MCARPQAARLGLEPARRVNVVAGAVPEELSATESLRGAARLDWSRFDPYAAGLSATADEVPAEPSAAAGLAVAEALLRSFAPAGNGTLQNGFAAVYRVQEKTPLGEAETEIRVDAGPGSTTVDVAGQRWKVRSRAGEEGAETQLPGSSAAPLPEPERLAAQLYRQPALLAAAATAGTLPVTLTTAMADEPSDANLTSTRAFLSSKATRKEQKLMMHQ